MNPFHPNHTFSKRPPPARRSVQLKARLPGERPRQVLLPALKETFKVFENRINTPIRDVHRDPEGDFGPLFQKELPLTWYFRFVKQLKNITA